MCTTTTTQTSIINCDDGCLQHFYIDIWANRTASRRERVSNVSYHRVQGSINHLPCSTADLQGRLRFLIHIISNYTTYINFTYIHSMGKASQVFVMQREHFSFGVAHCSYGTTHSIFFFLFILFFLLFFFESSSIRRIDLLLYTLWI